MKTAEGEESEDADNPRVRRTRQVHPRPGFSRAPWSIMLKKPELKQRNSESTQTVVDISAFCTSSSWSLCSWQSTERALIGCKELGREAVYTCGAEEQCGLKVSDSAKNAMWYEYVAWIRDGSTYKQQTVL